MVNCGAWTCGMTSQKCSNGIFEIIKDIAVGIGKIFVNVVTFGLSKILLTIYLMYVLKGGLITSLLANKQKMYQLAQQAGQQAMQDAYQNVKTWLSNNFLIYFSIILNFSKNTCN